MTDALRAATADYAEIRIELNEGVSMAYRGRELDSATSACYVGGIVRACRRGGWGVVTFDTLDSLPDRVREACVCASLVGREKTELAEVPPVCFESRARLEHDFRGVSLDDKLARMAHYNRILLGADPSIQTSWVNYADSFRTVWFASTRGTFFMEERPRVACVLSATAREGAHVQMAFDSTASATTYDVVLGLESRAEEIGRRAASLLRAPKADAGPQTVILDTHLAGIFVHEAFGHLSEGDAIYENPKLRDIMTLGREVGVPELNVWDDGSHPGTTATHRVDDEGTPTQKTGLIRNGVLAGHLHSLETAAKMGAAATGNARAVRRSCPPIVRMTNTYIDKGPLTREELFKGVDRGIYACDGFGGQTQLEMFTFSAAYGRRIENGQLGDIVRDVTLTGNVFQTLRRIDGIANDLTLHESAGGCGKAGQAPLPTTLGSPHIRIRDVLVGGK
jgi:TldD protein